MELLVAGLGPISLACDMEVKYEPARVSPIPVTSVGPSSDLSSVVRLFINI